MAFNAISYRRNQARRQAWAYLAEARAIKQRIAAGEAYSWEAPMIESRVKLARIAIVEALARIGEEWTAELPRAEQIVRTYIDQQEGGR